MKNKYVQTISHSWEDVKKLRSFLILVSQTLIWNSDNPKRQSRDELLQRGDAVLREDGIMRKGLSLALLSNAGLCPLVFRGFALIKGIVLLVFPESKGTERLIAKVCTR